MFGFVKQCKRAASAAARKVKSHPADNFNDGEYRLFAGECHWSVRPHEIKGNSDPFRRIVIVIDTNSVSFSTVPNGLLSPPKDLITGQLFLYSTENQFGGY